MSFPLEGRTDLVFYAPFSEGKGGITAEYASIPGSGTIVNGSWAGASNGKSWMELNNSTTVPPPQYGSFGSVSYYGSEFSLLFWCKPTLPASGQDVWISNDRTSTSAGNITIMFYATGSVRLTRSNYAASATYRWIESSNGCIQSGSVQHFALTFDKNWLAKFYRNAQFISGSTMPTITLDSGNYNFKIGRMNYDSNTGANGKIADVMLFNRALTPEEIKQIYKKTYRT